MNEERRGRGLPLGVRGILPPPSQVLLARDQLAALLACVAVPRCGARSPASLAPHAVLARDIGARFVMRVDRRLAISGHNLVSAAPQQQPGSGVTTEEEEEEAGGGGGGGGGKVDPFNVVVVGVSHTLGVVEMRGWCGIERSLVTFVFAWSGVGWSLPILDTSKIAVVDLADMTAAVEEVRGVGPVNGSLEICKGSKWAVLYPRHDAVGSGRIAILPLGGLHGGGACKAVDVPGEVAGADMINENEVALFTRTGIADTTASGQFHLICVDLEKSYESEQEVAVITGSFCGVDSCGLRKMVFTSNEHRTG
ncbi:hypothetical protein Pelo_18252 [Pelomyxa schiedti]|nr:hypothetical protein Pelo_18252 [Pelomyxa schiedti]